MRTRVCWALVLCVWLCIPGSAVAQTPAPPDDASPLSCAVANAPAAVLTSPNPVTPPLAAQFGFSGTVSVTVVVDAGGHAGLRQITQSPSPLLNAAALDVARKATFSAAIRNCTPVVSRLVLPVVFARTSATGPLPSAGAFFIGTWSCTSQKNAQSVFAFGRNMYGGSVMIGGWSSVSAAKYLNSSVSYYAEKAGVTTLLTTLSAGRLFVGTSHGWDGDQLVFEGEEMLPPRIDPAPAAAPFFPFRERATFVRSGADRFTRTVQIGTGSTAFADPNLEDTCARVVPPENT